MLTPSDNRSTGGGGVNKSPCIAMLLKGCEGAGLF